MPTRRRSSIVRLRACARVIAACWESTSEICAPMVIEGLSEVIGSWNTIEIPLPRICDSSASEALSRSMPRKHCLAALYATGRGWDETQQGLYRHALPAARFADNGKH